MTLPTSIETINGKLCTVIRRPFDAEWVREQLAMGVPVVTDLAVLLFAASEGRYYTERGYMVLDGARQHLPEARIKTILPALPKNPTPEHAALLYRYMAEGIYPVLVCPDSELSFLLRGIDRFGNALYKNLADEYDGISLSLCEINYAVPETGGRCEVAISDDFPTYEQIKTKARKLEDIAKDNPVICECEVAILEGGE